MDETEFYVTPQMLRNRGACLSAVNDVREVFGADMDTQIYLTKRNVATALNNNLNVYWLAMRIREKIGRKNNNSPYDPAVFRISIRDMDTVEKNVWSTATPDRVARVFNALVRLSTKAQ